MWNNCTLNKVYFKLQTHPWQRNANAPFTFSIISCFPRHAICPFSFPSFFFFPPHYSLLPLYSHTPCARPGCCRHLIWLPCDRLTGNEEVEGALETGAGVQHSLFGQRLAAMSFTAAPHHSTSSLSLSLLSSFFPSFFPLSFPPSPLFSSWEKRTMQSITRWHAWT